jgi:hypothetical protein
MFQIRNTIGFTGGTISIYDIVYSSVTSGLDGNRFPNLNFTPIYTSNVPIDAASFVDWLIVPKF